MAKKIPNKSNGKKVIPKESNISAVEKSVPSLLSGTVIIVAILLLILIIEKNI